MKLYQKALVRFFESLFLTSLLALLILLVFSDAIFAQPSLPTGPSQAPIDGGLSLVAAAGGAYAYKKFKKNKKV